MMMIPDKLSVLALGTQFNNKWGSKKVLVNSSRLGDLSIKYAVSYSNRMTFFCNLML